MLITTNLHKKSSEVSVKAGLPPASFSFGGRAAEHTNVNWSIDSSKTQAYVGHFVLFGSRIIHSIGNE